MDSLRERVKETFPEFADYTADGHWPDLGRVLRQKAGDLDGHFVAACIRDNRIDDLFREAGRRSLAQALYGEWKKSPLQKGRPS